MRTLFIPYCGMTMVNHILNLRRSGVALLILLSTVSCGSENTEASSSIPPLKLMTALPINGPDDNQPSGLTLHEDQLLTVSDKNETTIYVLDVGDQVVTQRPLHSFDPDTLPGKSSHLDLEGITSDGDQLLLASETHFRVLRFNEGLVSWATPALREIGGQVGLYATRGAGIEALVLLQDQIIVSSERQPRGLVIVSTKTGAAEALEMDDTRFPPPSNRSPDFTGLTVFDNRLFVLQRNAHVVSELIRDEDGVWREGDGFQYAHVEQAPAYAYTNQRFGIAEGIAMDQDWIYIILDNNFDARVADEDDRRPQLLIFENPYGQQ
ncbi:MAG: hypothetical protein AAF525_17590 [Pseudomonadota bacterium]